MSFVSKVTNGKIDIPPGIDLPEGASVRVEPLKENTPATRLTGIIGSVEGLPRDFSAQHDYYLHGTPKRRRRKAASSSR
jgi:hypothetical protein